MQFELRDVDFEDGPAISHLHVSAFYDDIFNQTLFPGVSFDGLLANTISRWPQNYADRGCRFKKVVDTATGEIVSYSKWSFFNTPSSIELPGHHDVLMSSPNTPSLQTTDEGRDISFSDKFSEKCKAAKAVAVGDRPRMVLDVLATSPAHQRRGAASLMLEWATGFADQNELVCVTIASTKGLPLYQKFGFEVVDNIAMLMIDGSTYISTCIVREYQSRLPSSK
ncbi:hypothetical protein GGR57DRAFT_332995 [Xylariaceae sp. FL1272]|nr:hypothetical protein GGR57DRAFT_332995 [Xylariaceae sp. FL1272]